MRANFARVRTTGGICISVGVNLESIVSMDETERRLEVEQASRDGRIFATDMLMHSILQAMCQDRALAEALLGAMRNQKLPEYSRQFAGEARRGNPDPRDLSIGIASAMAGVYEAAAMCANSTGTGSEAAEEIKGILSDMANTLSEAAIEGERKIKETDGA